MTAARPFISVCIPAYNRADVLGDLLESILTQDFDAYEIVVCEDGSPQRQAIRAVVESLPPPRASRVRYIENDRNLGYDGNVRNVLAHAAGEYCLLMGNDDLMCPGALSTVAKGLRAHQGVAVVMRTYASFDDDPSQVNQVFRYFDRERLFDPGRDTIVTFFRRCVVLPGLVLHRDAAVALATDEFDGSLLYQLYLVGRMLADKRGLFLPEVITLYRNGGVPDFGNSPAEKGKFVPGTVTPDASVHFMASMLRIAAAVEARTGLAVYRPIVRDLANYSYPFLAIQSHRSTRLFVRYCWRLARLGFGRHPLFWAYMMALLLLGQRRVDGFIRVVKRRMGHTPALGGLYQGKPV